MRIIWLCAGSDWGVLAPAQTQAAAEPGPNVEKLLIKCEIALYTLNLCVDVDLFYICLYI